MKKATIYLLLLCNLLLTAHVFAQTDEVLPDANGELFEAIYKENMAGVKQAIKDGADPNARYKYSRFVFAYRGMTPYMLACVRNQKEIAEYLEQQGADIKLYVRRMKEMKNKAVRHPGKNVLHLVAHYGNTKLVEYFLNKGFSVDEPTKNGKDTPLTIACQNYRRENLKVVKLLLAKGANVHFNKDRALFEAAYRGYNRIVQYLIDKGAKVNQVIGKNHKGRFKSPYTPLYNAIQQRKSQTVKLLIKNGANVNKMPEAIVTPLQVAARHNLVFVAHFLIKKGANINAEGYNGTAISIARWRKNKEVLRVLQGKGLTPREQKLLHYKNTFSRAKIYNPARNVSKLEENSFKDINGKTHTLSSLKGKVVFINFWAMWCPPCLKEMPELVKLHKMMKGKPFVMLTVSIDKNREKLMRFLKEKKYPFPVIHDPKAYLWRKVFYGGLPITYILDGNGKRAASLLGSYQWTNSKAVGLLNALMMKE